MRGSPTASCALLVGLSLLVSVVILAAQSVPPPPQSTFRSAVTLVPVDVHVIDPKTGAPVTGLSREDFTVFEDDVRQEIRHFAIQSFEDAARDETPARAIAPDAASKAAIAPPQSPMPAQTRRVFLLVLGRGRLQNGPAKALDAAARFVRTQLRPRDLVSVFAFDRATDFTSEHEQAAAVIDRFKAENDEIESALASPGLAAVYGSRDVPASVQARVDRVFRGTSTLPYSPVGGGMPSRTRERLQQDVRRQAEDVLDRMIDAGRLTAQEAGGPIAMPAASGREWESFDSFASRNMQTLNDTQNLYAAIAYMQRIEGQKHLVYMTRSGVSLQHLEDYKRIAAVAADARVALDVMQGAFDDVLQAAAMRSVSEDTGGVSSIAEYGHVAFDRVDETTRTGYLLGYYPSATAKRGAYRQIRVTVNRPGVTVLFRHGYRSVDEMPEFDRRGQLTQFRLMAAARYARDIKDIPVTMRADVKAVKGQFEVTIDARIDASRLTLTVQDGVHVGRFEIAVVAADAKGQVLAGQNNTLEPKFGDERFARILKDGLRCEYRMPVPSGTRYVRFIVYDYDADRLGTAGSRVF